jgi:dihydrolipoamide dehydrogenase
MKVDRAFLGGGPAGYQGAIRSAQRGAKVAVIEELPVGGVC